MACVTRIVLHVSKPVTPNVLDFASAIAALNPSYRVEVKKHMTIPDGETVDVMIEGRNLLVEAINVVVAGMGGTISDIKEVAVVGAPYAQ